MDTETATTDQIQFPVSDTVVSPPQEILVPAFSPPDPIVLTPGANSSKESNTTKRGFLSTFGLLLSGWLVGNLIILATVGIVAAVAAGSTGLVKVPLLTNYLFGKETPVYKTPDALSLSSAEDKINQIKSLKQGQVIDNLELSQDEINALLDRQIDTATNFPIGNQSLKLENNQFIFTGNLVKTNAPVEIRGNVDVTSLTAKITIISAKFGKLDIPTVIAGNIVDSSLSKIGLSLAGSQIPAQSLKILDGGLKLQQVVNSQ